MDIMSGVSIKLMTVETFLDAELAILVNSMYMYVLI